MPHLRLALALLLGAARRPCGPAAGSARRRELQQALRPHFQREEEIALPPLVLLEPLAAGGTPPEARSVLPMTDAHREELPQRLAEHHRIHAAVARLREAAVAEQQPRFVRFADELALHTQAEEEIYYPAAILVGDLVRARLKG